MAALDLFTYYNNRSLGGVTDPNSDQAQAALRQVQQYDPTASYRPTFGSDGQLIGYTLDYDASKLPGVNGATSLGGTSGHGSGADYMPRFSTVQPNMQLADPNAVTNDANYGKITDNTNIQQPSSLLDYLGPAAVAGFGLLMGGIPSLYQGVFGQGSFGGADLSGLGVSDPFVQGGTGAMDVSGSYGTGIPGSLGSNLGGAESSLYGAGALTDPANALGGAPFNLGDQPLLPMMPQEPVYNPMTPFNPADPSYGQFAINPDGTATAGAQLASQLAGGSGLLAQAGRALSALGKIPGLNGGSGTGSGGGGGNGLLAMAPRAQQTYTDLTNILRHFYGGGNG